jgi:hypothetical protein
MVLHPTKRIVISGRKIFLQIALDVMGFAETLQLGDHPLRIALQSIALPNSPR